MPGPRPVAREFLFSVLDGTAPREPNGCILWPYPRSTLANWVHGRERTP